MHTTWSDGRAALETMVAGCEARGYGVPAPFHGPRATGPCKGSNASALRAQHGEMAGPVQARHPSIRGLRALELDVMEDGSLPLSEDELAPLFGPPARRRPHAPRAAARGADPALACGRSTTREWRSSPIRRRGASAAAVTSTRIGTRSRPRPQRALFRFFLAHPSELDLDGGLRARTRRPAGVVVVEPTPTGASSTTCPLGRRAGRAAAGSSPRTSCEHAAARRAALLAAAEARARRRNKIYAGSPSTSGRVRRATRPGSPSACSRSAAGRRG